MPETMAAFTRLLRALRELRSALWDSEGAMISLGSWLSGAGFASCMWTLIVFWAPGSLSQFLSGLLPSAAFAWLGSYMMGRAVGLKQEREALLMQRLGEVEGQRGGLVPQPTKGGVDWL